jgi:DNA-binding MarR family transcriptional regulator
MIARRAARNPLRLAGYLPYRLSVAAHAVSSLIAGSYEQRFRLPIPQWRMMAILEEHGSLTQQDLVPLSTMDKQMVSRAARALLKRGLIRRADSKTDGRAYTLSLTAQGRSLYRKVVPLALQYERRLLQGLSAAQLRRLHALLMLLEERARDYPLTKRQPGDWR